VCIKDDIRSLASNYAVRLKEQMDLRIQDMQFDDTSHYLIYRVLGISITEGRLIDEYQNKGRFLYKYAGAFLEDAAKYCFKNKNAEAVSLRIPNTHGVKPKTFEIDCVHGKLAIEIKWRDATTDGDHITKENTRLQAVVDAGYTPIRVMFFYPNRDQAIRIQQSLETLYKGAGGRYYYADAAWDFVREQSGIDLKQILEELAAERILENG
jgi:hypothetical protein